MQIFYLRDSLNNVKDFINDINDLSLGEGIGVFVKVEKVIVRGLNEDRFLV